MSDTKDITKWGKLVDKMFESEEGEKKDCSLEDVIDFLKENPNPNDDAVHSWAEEKGFDAHKVESKFYQLATKYVKSLDKEEKKDE